MFRMIIKPLERNTEKFWGGSEQCITNLTMNIDYLLTQTSPIGTYKNRVLSVSYVQCRLIVIIKGSAMAQAMSRLPLTSETRTVVCETDFGQSGIWTGFDTSGSGLRLSLSFYQRAVLTLHLNTTVTRRTSGRNPVTFREGSAFFFGYRRSLDVEVLSLSFCFGFKRFNPYPANVEYRVSS
jgi:hypothetical protein